MASTPARRAIPSDVDSVVISAEAHAGLVARVGRSSAATFVAIALTAIRDERGVLVVRTSARALAGHLGIAKDTAAGELAWLIKRGYLRRLAQPRSGGRFAPALYVVRPPVGFEVVVGAAASRPCPIPPDMVSGSRQRHLPTPTPALARRSLASQRRDGDAQLGLFGAPSPITETRGPR